MAFRPSFGCLYLLENGWMTDMNCSERIRVVLHRRGLLRNVSSRHAVLEDVSVHLSRRVDPRHIQHYRRGMSRERGADGSVSTICGGLRGSWTRWTDSNRVSSNRVVKVLSRHSDFLGHWEQHSHVSKPIPTTLRKTDTKQSRPVTTPPACPCSFSVTTSTPFLASSGHSS